MDCPLFPTPEPSSRPLDRERDRLAKLFGFLRRSSQPVPIDLRPSNPNLPIDWRWQLARFLATLSSPTPPRFLDSWTSRAVDCLRFTNRAAGDWAEITRLAQIGSRLPENNTPPTKFPPDNTEQYVTVQELCSRLLAGQSNQQIAERLPLRPDVIEGFEQLHFAVRERLDGPSFIRFHAIGEYRGGPLERLGVLWRRYAYARGAAVLDYLVTTYRSFPADVRSRGIEAYIADEVPCPELIRLLVQVWELDITPENAVDSWRWLDHASCRLRQLRSSVADPEEAAAKPGENPAPNPALSPVGPQPAAAPGPCIKAA